VEDLLLLLLELGADLRDQAVELRRVVADEPLVPLGHREPDRARKLAEHIELVREAAERLGTE
jgi:hypothetical protein